MGKSFTFDITSKCNLRCTHCYNAEEYFSFRNNNDLTYDECIQLFNMLKKDGYTEISILGGEPFARNDIFDLLEFLDINGFEIDITTNGTFISKNAVKKLSEINIRNLIISIDGYNAKLHDMIRGTGVYKKVINGLEILKSMENRNFNLCISHTITNYNIDNLYKMIDLCKEYNIDEISIFTIMKAGNGSKNWEELSNDVVKYIDAIEKMVQYSKKICPLLNISIESRPSLCLYFNIKYTTNVLYPLGYTKCQADDKFIYIDAKGIIHNCGLYKLDVGKEAIQNGYMQLNKVRFNEFSSVDDFFKSEESKNFFKSKRELKREQYSDYCETCYVREDCKPCPYQFEDGAMECQVVWPLIQRELENIMNQKVIFRSIEMNEWVKSKFGIIYEKVNSFGDEILISELIHEVISGDDINKIISIILLLREMELFYLVTIK